MTENDRSRDRAPAGTGSLVSTPGSGRLKGVNSHLENPDIVFNVPGEDRKRDGPENFSCPFCNPSREYIVLSNDLCYARWDINPVSRGHILVIPFRHVPDFFALTASEKAAVMDLATGVRAIIETKFHPAGYNFGVNIEEAAGQLVRHVHFHLIPRYYGDATSKPNGMRNVIPKHPSRQHKLSEYIHSEEQGGRKRSKTL